MSARVRVPLTVASTMPVRKLGGALLWVSLCVASAAGAQSAVQVRETGASGIRLLANFCYTGMRAQEHPSVGWRLVSFIFGLPGTLLTWNLVPESEERALSKYAAPKTLLPDPARVLRPRTSSRMQSRSQLPVHLAAGASLSYRSGAQGTARASWCRERRVRSGDGTRVSRRNPSRR